MEVKYFGFWLNLIVYNLLKQKKLANNSDAIPKLFNKIWNPNIRNFVSNMYEKCLNDSI